METRERTESREPVAAPSHLIERSRLIKQIEESGARIVVLHAPAGYGKTTLARQWSGRQPRPPIWYRCTSASSDVAVLAIGVATAVSSLAPGVEAEMLRSLRASSNPPRDVERFVELLVPRLSGWPPDAWFVIDDYHHVGMSEAAEAVIEGLALDSPIQLLVISRIRPAWASTRRVLYGEVLDLDHHSLSFTRAESGRVLGDEGGPFAKLAQGWPAIVGLAARLGRLSPPPDRLPEELYDFLADELYIGSPPEVQEASLRLAVCPILDRRSTEVVLRAEDWPEALEHCARLGFLQRERDGFEMHPLLRSFLIEKIRRSAGDDLETQVPRQLGFDLLSQSRWAEVFSLHLSFPRAELFIPLLEASLDDLIENGRLETIERWLEHASAESVRHPLVDLAAAKLALRRGEYARAEILATTAAEELAQAHPALANALITAGQAAMLGDNANAARNLFARARTTASTRRDRREAVLGDFFAALELEDQDAPELLAELEESDQLDAQTKLRLASAHLVLSALAGNVSTALDDAAPFIHLLERVDDAYAKSSFLIAVASMSSLAGRYGEALSAAHRALGVARELGVSFAVPHAQTHLATAEMGLRRFSAAARTLREVETRARSLSDAFLEGNSRCFQARLLLMRGRSAEALELLSATPAGLHHPGMHAEHHTTRALILATQGALAEALREGDAFASQRAEARTLRAWSRAIAHLQDPSLVPDTPHDAFSVASTTGAFDTFVCAYRAYPQLLTDLALDASLQPRLAAVLSRANDDALATRVGLPLTGVKPEAAALSRRELEVLHLLHEGLTNREIAQALYISLATVKVHVHHIYGKLGVRNRAEAVSRLPDL
jgi:ATP/maltotriose-dependent transcriptional regulator MalT